MKPYNTVGKIVGVVIIIWIVIATINSLNLFEKREPQVQFSLHPYNEFINESINKCESIIGKPDTSFYDYYSDNLIFIYEKQEPLIWDPTMPFIFKGKMYLYPPGNRVISTKLRIRYNNGSVRNKIYCTYCTSIVFEFNKKGNLKSIWYPDGTYITN